MRTNFLPSCARSHGIGSTVYLVPRFSVSLFSQPLMASGAFAETAGNPADLWRGSRTDGTDDFTRPARAKARRCASQRRDQKAPRYRKQQIFSKLVNRRLGEVDTGSPRSVRREIGTSARVPLEQHSRPGRRASVHLPASGRIRPRPSQLRSSRPSRRSLSLGFPPLSLEGIRFLAAQRTQRQILCQLSLDRRHPRSTNPATQESSRFEENLQNSLAFGSQSCSTLAKNIRVAGVRIVGDDMNIFGVTDPSKFSALSVDERPKRAVVGTLAYILRKCS